MDWNPIRKYKEHQAKLQQEWEEAAKAPNEFKAKLEEFTERQWEGESYKFVYREIRYVMQLQNPHAVSIVCEAFNKAFLKHEESPVFIDLGEGKIGITAEAAKKVLSRRLSPEDQKRVKNLAKDIKDAEESCITAMELTVGRSAAQAISSQEPG